MLEAVVPVLRRIGLLWALSAVTWVSAAPAPIPPPTPLTVEQAVALALQQNPTVTLARQNVQYALTQVNVARANGRPNVALNAQGSYVPSPTTTNFNGSNITLTPMYSAAGTLTVSQPVWPRTEWQAPINSANANVGINEETLQRTRQQIVFQTRQAYYQVLGNYELQAAAQDAVTVAQTQLKLAESTVNAGLAAPLDIYQARAVLANAQVSAVQAKNAVDVALANLAADIGLPASTPLTIEMSTRLPALPPDLARLTQQAIRQRPELAQLTFRRRQLQASIDLFHLEHQPIVSLSASYAQPLVGTNIFGSNGLSIAAVAALNLYNGGKTRAEVEGARVQIAELDTTATQLELSIGLDVRQAWLNLQNALQQITSAEQGRDAAAEALRIAEIRYRNGEGIVLEVDQARLNHTQSLTALAQARFQALVAAAQLDFALGTPIQMPVQTK